jgi:hypothetical protein
MCVCACCVSSVNGINGGGSSGGSDLEYNVNGTLIQNGYIANGVADVSKYPNLPVLDVMPHW